MKIPDRVSTAHVAGGARRVRRRTRTESPPSEEIRHWIDFACERCQCPELAPRMTCRFNRRLTRLVGQAKVLFVNGVAEKLGIELATRSWNRLNDVGQRNTVVHEACHVIAACAFGPKIPGHGIHWKWAMRRCDTPPDVFLEDYEIKEEYRPSEQFRPPGLVLARCGCTGHRKVPVGQAKLIRWGERFRCEVCRQLLTLVFG